MSDGMGRELAYLSSHATNRYFIPNWGISCFFKGKDMSEREVGKRQKFVRIYIELSHRYRKDSL